MVKIGDKIPELSKVKFLFMAEHIFDVDHDAKIRFALFISVLEKIVTGWFKNFRDNGFRKSRKFLTFFHKSRKFLNLPVLKITAFKK